MCCCAGYEPDGLNGMKPDRGKIKKPYVIAIANEKGGVGKTTTTLSVGTILSRMGYDVVFIDLDPQGNLTLALGYKPQELQNYDDVLQLETDPGQGNLSLLFAKSLLVDNDYRMRLSFINYEDQLSRDLRSVIVRAGDYVLIDCPPSISKVAINALKITDFLIVPTQADFFSAVALKDMLELVAYVRQHGNPGLLYRIVITLFDQRNSIHHGIRNQLNHTFGTGIFKTKIEVDAELRRASLLGFPTRKSRGVEQYEAMVEELLAYIRDVQP